MDPTNPTKTIEDLTHKQAMNRMADIQAELERLSDKAAKGRLPDEEETYRQGLVAEFEECDDQRLRLEQESDLARIKARSAVTQRPQMAERGTPPPRASISGVEYDADPVANPDSIEDKRFRNPWDLSEMRTFSRSKGEISQELRSRALSAVEKMSGANDQVRSTATSIIEAFDDGDSKISRMCLATSSPEYLRAWCKLASGRAHMVTTEEQQAVNRAMSLTDSAGGYLVPFQLDPTVILTSDGSLNEIRQVARSVVATGDVWHGVSAGEVNWGWAGEFQEASDNSPSFAQPQVQVHKAQGFVPISIEALEDEANVTSEVGKLLAQGKDTLEAQAFINGTGAGQPYGIVTALDGTSSVVNSTASDAFSSDDVYLMDESLPARYRGQATWLGHRGVYNDIRNFDTQGGAQLWERIGNDMPPQLLGRSVYEAEAMDSDSATTGKQVLVYGDHSSFVIADRIGMTVELIPHLFGGAQRPTGARGWYAYYRVGADVVNRGGLRLLTIS